MVAKLKHNSIVIFTLVVTTRGDKLSRKLLSLPRGSKEIFDSKAPKDGYFEKFGFDSSDRNCKELNKALLCRCGSTENCEEDAQLDAYIEQLVAGVDESDTESSLLDVGSEEKSVDVDVDFDESEAEKDEMQDHRLDDKVDDKVNVDESEVEKDEIQDHRLDDMVDGNVDDKPEEQATTMEELAHDEVKEETAVETETIQKEINTKPQKRYPPPNLVYRFLLGKGIVGRTMVMAMILFFEFLNAFLPRTARVLRLLTSPLIGGDARRRRANDVPLRDSLVNDQYAAFTSGSRSGKQSKAITKKADKIAAEQLRRVGNLQKARYRHVSEDFLRRHKLGPFKLEEDDVIPFAEEVEEGDEEEDVDWVAEGLKTVDDNATGKPSLSIGVSNKGLEVGVEFSIGGGKSGGKRKKKRRSISERSSLLMEATKSQTTSSRSTKRKKIGPRVSDREGGGGVMGRLRSMSANNLVSRSLLGAYPGDALPPLEAASSSGVLELANRYGYDDLSEEDESFQERPRRKRRRRSNHSSSSAKKRSSQIKVEDGTDESNSFENRRVSLTARRNVEASFKRTSKSKIVRLPMELTTEERIRLKSEKAERSKTQPSVEPET
eukprot:CAMPEP_0178896684 /NCGR_PEP_ID=MMETSP0786-20121207/1317_1 /TAXON_ID=186022 /ORGANISM="Thalassionema frauenfeldii, Strain CCMP 1798" /LENGTH=605 /DNA_ID=CAMNT_0020567129 /DNA_START=132 /DNA_END=1949 /DNA_ORIENTATION=-